jgi:hypothetical protein
VFSLIKRGLVGTYHSVSRYHLHRYLDEFAFRWNTRRLNDGERAVKAVLAGVGKRVVYRQHGGSAAYGERPSAIVGRVMKKPPAKERGPKPRVLSVNIPPEEVLRRMFSAKPTKKARRRK